MKEQYFGEKQVQSLVKEDVKTYSGKDILTVVYVDGSKELMSQASFDALVTDEKSDATNLQKRKFTFLVLKIAETLSEYDVKFGEIGQLMHLAGENLIAAANRASHYLWTKDSVPFIPDGNDAINNRSLLEADLIIRSIPNGKEVK
jgi:hypothetical protein